MIRCEGSAAIRCQTFLLSCFAIIMVMNTLRRCATTLLQCMCQLLAANSNYQIALFLKNISASNGWTKSISQHPPRDNERTPEGKATIENIEQLGYISLGAGHENETFFQDRLICEQEREAVKRAPRDEEPSYEKLNDAQSLETLQHLCRRTGSNTMSMIRILVSETFRARMTT